jgi:hypothetical protein
LLGAVVSHYRPLLVAPERRAVGEFKDTGFDHFTVGGNNPEAPPDSFAAL